MKQAVQIFRQMFGGFPLIISHGFVYNTIIMNEEVRPLAKERIGILGGTFDPIHKGHIAMARAALKSAKLDRVLVVPSGNPPHKKNISPSEDRWRMVCAALAQEDRLEPSRVEIDREGVIYTVDTLRILQDTYRKAELFFIIGADTLLELKNWHLYETVLKLCTFIICPRQWEARPEELAEEERRRRHRAASG